MARNRKKEDDKQRNAAVSVYLTPALRQWLDERIAKTGNSLSSELRCAVLEHAEAQGFKEENYESKIETNDVIQSETSEVSLVARQLADLAVTIERMMKNGTKCFAV